MKKETPHGYKPGQGLNFSMHVDLEDLCKKGMAHGPWHILGETFLNLCLLANDQMKLAKGGKLHEPDGSGTKG